MDFGRFTVAQLDQTLCYAPFVLLLGAAVVIIGGVAVALWYRGSWKSPEQ
ncbi:MAG: hypothetical protein PHT12_01105 [Patescibacteria group bacterium]|nr:hypothetical protein [Patescibacteria group bacterium]